MLEYLKKHLAALVAGAVILSGGTYVAAQELSAPASPDEVTLAQADEPDEPEAPGAEEGEGKPEGRPGHPGLHRAIRGELVVPGQEDGTFETVKIDRGILKSVDGTTLVIEEADGTTVNVAANDETRINRDREEADLSDLVAGDHVGAFQKKEGEAFVAKGIRAISAEKWEEFQEHREERMDDRRGPGGPGRPGGPGGPEGPEGEGGPEAEL
jgi:hypothetical protein